MAKAERKAIDKVFVLLGVVGMGALVTVGGLAYYGYDFATTMVRTELTAQKIYFPPKDSPALKALKDEDRVAMEQYAGQQLTTGDQAKVYANNFIGAHLEKTADGKTYAEVSTEAMKDPTNEKLKAQKTTLFQGETLRGMLLGTGYAFWTFGMIAYYSAITAFVGAAIMGLLVLLGLRHMGKSK